MTLESADKLAARIREELAPFCERIDIAGSIRRRRPFVNDVDVVVLPKPDKERELRLRCKERAKRVNMEGEQMLVVTLANDLQVDIWLAHGEKSDMFDSTATNYGSLLICRTGSAGHNIFLVEHAKRKGLRWNPHHGVFDSRSGKAVCIASATEEEVFKALGLDFVAPENRERN